MKYIAALLLLSIFAHVSSAENNGVSLPVAFFLFLNSCIASMEMDLEPTPLAFRPFTMRDARQLRNDCEINCNDALDAVTAAISSLDDMINQLSSSSNQLTADAIAITSACSGGVDTAYVSLSSCPGRPSAGYNFAATPPARQEVEMLHTTAPFTSLF